VLNKATNQNMIAKSISVDKIYANKEEIIKQASLSSPNILRVRDFFLGNKESWIITES
jgi:hypothetical protein